MIICLLNCKCVWFAHMNTVLTVIFQVKQDKLVACLILIVQFSLSQDKPKLPKVFIPTCYFDLYPAGPLTLATIFEADFFCRPTNTIIVLKTESILSIIDL